MSRFGQPQSVLCRKGDFQTCSMFTHSHPARAAHHVGHRWSELMAFKGLPTGQNLDGLLSSLEGLVVQRTEDRRVFRAIIECVQNLERHAAPDCPVLFKLMGRVVNGGPRFCIRSLNPIRTGDFDQVAQWISNYTDLQHWASDALHEGEVDWRTLYRKWLGQPSRSSRGGAGLGWVSLARLSLRPPVLRIIHVGGEPNLFFSVEVACGG